MRLRLGFIYKSRYLGYTLAPARLIRRHVDPSLKVPNNVKVSDPYRACVLATHGTSTF